MGNGLCDVQRSERRGSLRLNLDNFDARRPKIKSEQKNFPLAPCLPSFLQMPLNAKLIFCDFPLEVLETSTKSVLLSQLFSRRRMSFRWSRRVWLKSFPQKSERRQESCLEKFSIGHVTKLHNVARWLCDYFRYDNLFIISCSLSYLFRCTIRSRWNRLIVKIVMVSAEHFMCNLLSLKAVLLPAKEREKKIATKKWWFLCFIASHSRVTPEGVFWRKSDALCDTKVILITQLLGSQPTWPRSPGRQQSASKFNVATESENNAARKKNPITEWAAAWLWRLN